MGKEDMVAPPRPYFGGYGYQEPMYQQGYAPGRPMGAANYQQFGDYGTPQQALYQPGQCRPYEAQYGPQGSFGAYPPNGYAPNGYQSPYDPYAYDQQQPNNQRPGMSNGSKMAMAAAGGLALGAGTAFAVDHAGDIAHFAEEAVDDLGGFVGDGFRGVENFVQGIF